MAKGENLYDMPFEKRIRIKYLMFGSVLALSGIGLLGMILLVGDIALLVLIDRPIDMNENLFSLFILFAPLAYYCWYSKAKPIKHQYLNETVGLKADYEGLQ